MVAVNHHSVAASYYYLLCPWAAHNTYKDEKLKNYAHKQETIKTSHCDDEVIYEVT